jgi:DNA-binding GntR family transcriptional regulator
VPGTGRVVRTPGQPLGASPRYRQIAEELRTRIEDGELAPGDLLPSESALVERHRVSRGTARRALLDLETAGLVESRPGEGRIVWQRPGAGADEIPRRYGPEDVVTKSMRRAAPAIRRTISDIEQRMV